MHLHMHINIPEMSHNLQFLCVDMHFSSSVYVWERTLLCDISRYRDTCALTTLSSCLFQCGCQKVGRKINEGLCNRARGWWGWMIIVLLFTSYSLCHDVIILRHNPGLAQLVVVFSIPTKTTAFWLITHWHYTGLVWWTVQRNKPRWNRFAVAYIDYQHQCICGSIVGVCAKISWHQ